jgi:hypothetical protein
MDWYLPFGISGLRAIGDLSEHGSRIAGIWGAKTAILDSSNLKRSLTLRNPTRRPRQG